MTVKRTYKTLRLSEKTLQELDFLVSAYGEQASAVMRRLITEAYTRQVELDKKRRKR